MGAFSTLTSKGQVTIPKDVRERMKLMVGDTIAFVPMGESTMLIPRNKPVESLFGLLADHAIPGTSLADFDEAIGQAVAEHVEGKRLKKARNAA